LPKEKNFIVRKEEKKDDFILRRRQREGKKGGRQAEGKEKKGHAEVMPGFPSPRKGRGFST